MIDLQRLQIGIASAMLACVATASAEEGIELKAQWPVGKVFTFHEETAMSQSMAMPGLPEPMSQDMRQDQTYSISVLNETADGGRVLQMRFESFKITINLPGSEPMVFDSTSPDQDAPHPAMQAYQHLVGAALNIHLDGKGNVPHADGMSKVLDQMKTDGGGNAAMLEDMFSEQTVTHMYEYMFKHGLPDKAISVSDTWSSSYDMPVGALGKMSMRIDSTFTGMEEQGGRECAAVTFSGTMSGEMEGADQLAGMRMSFKDGDIAGKRYVDPKFGLSVSSLTDLTLTAEMTMPTPGGAGQTTTMTIKQHRSMTLKGIADMAKAGAGNVESVER